MVAIPAVSEMSVDWYLFYTLDFSYWKIEDRGGYSNLGVTLSLLPISLSDDDMFTLPKGSCVVSREIFRTGNTTKKCLLGFEHQTLCRGHTRVPNHKCYLDITLKSFGLRHAAVFCLQLASTGRA